MEKDIIELKEAWKRTTDSDVIKAATQNWEECPARVKDIIEAEAKDRDLWRKALYLRGETKEFPFYNYSCPACEGTIFSLKIGRCAQCNFPEKNIAYCGTCNNFFSEFKPDLICPNDGNKLVVGHRPASQGIRFVNQTLDLFIPVLLSTFVSVIAGLSYEADWLCWCCLTFLYYFIFESLFQRTPAKFLTRTKVVNNYGTKPTVGTIALRTLIRFVPFEEFSFLGDRVYGWHDKWSKTYVVKVPHLVKSCVER
jgi:hypothetical protein